ncbi:unnamed protein product [Scytosiphon promiscuus]
MSEPYSRTAKGGLHSGRGGWCTPALAIRARIVMWFVWETILSLLAPLRVLVGGMGSQSTITLDNGTR